MEGFGSSSQAPQQQESKFSGFLGGGKKDTSGSGSGSGPGRRWGSSNSSSFNSSASQKNVEPYSSKVLVPRTCEARCLFRFRGVYLYTASIRFTTIFCKQYQQETRASPASGAYDPYRPSEESRSYRMRGSIDHAKALQAAKGSAERRIVDQLTAPGGVRAQPPKEQLQVCLLIET